MYAEWGTELNEDNTYTSRYDGGKFKAKIYRNNGRRFDKYRLSKGDILSVRRVVASPLKRCIQTAEYIYPNVDIEICDKLKECDFGDFENKSYEDLKDNPDYQKWLDSNGELPFPNGETHEDFKNRCKEGFFESLTERDTAFVIHGGSIMAIMQKLFGGNFYDYQVKNGCGYEFEMRNGEIVDDYSPIGCG